MPGEGVCWGVQIPGRTEPQERVHPGVGGGGSVYQLRWPWLCPRCSREHPRPSSPSLSPQLPALCPASCLSAPVPWWRWGPLYFPLSFLTVNIEISIENLPGRKKWGKTQGGEKMPELKKWGEILNILELLTGEQPCEQWMRSQCISSLFAHLYTKHEREDNACPPRGCCTDQIQ